MTFFNKDKLFMTISNILICISFFAVYIPNVLDKNIPYYGIIGFVLWFLSLIVILGSFILKRNKFNNQNDKIQATNFNNYQKQKLSFIFQTIGSSLCLIAIIIGITSNASQLTNIIFFNIVLGVIFIVTIIANYLETTARISMVYSITEKIKDVKKDKTENKRDKI